MEGVGVVVGVTEAVKLGVRVPVEVEETETVGVTDGVTEGVREGVGVFVGVGELDGGMAHVPLIFTCEACGHTHDCAGTDQYPPTRGASA